MPGSLRPLRRGSSPLVSHVCPDPTCIVNLITIHSPGGWHPELLPSATLKFPSPPRASLSLSSLNSDPAYPGLSFILVFMHCGPRYKSDLACVYNKTALEFSLPHVWTYCLWLLWWHNSRVEVYTDYCLSLMEKGCGPSVLSCCHNEQTPCPKQLGEERVFGFQVTVLHHGMPSGRSTVCWLAQLAFLNTPGPLPQEWHCPQWTGPSYINQLAIKKMPLRHAY